MFNMNYFDLMAPIYEIIIFGAKKTFLKLDSLANFQKNDKVLDLGGGAGRIAKFFIGKVKEITVADNSLQMIAVCQKHQGLNCILTNAEKLPFPDNYFDKVIMVDAFHHFQNQTQVIQEIKRVLKSKGNILTKEINPQNFFGWVWAKLEIILGLKSQFYSPFSLSRLFEKYNFKTKSVIKTQMYYYFAAEKIK